MKDRIKEWLKAQNHDRDWLGEQVGVSTKTVHNWLSSPQDIPAGKLKLIEKLMQEDEAAEAQRRQQLQPTAQVFSLEVDLPTFRAYSAAALADGKMLEQWAISELNAAAEASLQSPSKAVPAKTAFQALNATYHLGMTPRKITAPDSPKPTASTVKTGAIPTPTQPAQAAASPSPIIEMPVQHIAAEETAEYQVNPVKQSS